MSKDIETKYLKDFAKTLEGKFLFTNSHKKQFTVNVVGDTLEFIPQSSGISRIESNKSLEIVIEYFNKTHSFESKDYHDITYNSVYILRLIEVYLSAVNK